MLRLAVLFFIIAIVAALFGFVDVEFVAAGAARICFFVFLVLAILSLLFGAFRGTAPPPI